MENKMIDITATFRQKVQIDMYDAIKQIKEALGFDLTAGEFMKVENGKLIHAEDISYHGSPQYQYTEISNNPNYIAIYNSLNILEEYFSDRSAPKWAKHIEQAEQKPSIKKQLAEAPKQPEQKPKNIDKGAR